MIISKHDQRQNEDAVHPHHIPIVADHIIRHGIRHRKRDHARVLIFDISSVQGSVSKGPAARNDLQGYDQTDRHIQLIFIKHSTLKNSGFFVPRFEN